MEDLTTLIVLDSFITSHTQVIRNVSVLTDFDMAELFEVDIDSIRKLTFSNPELFPNDSMLILTNDESLQYKGAKYVFTDPGVFALAGLLKTKRSIRIYVKLIELLVNRLQGKAYEIASSYQRT